MPKDVKHRLERARQAVASWLSSADENQSAGRKRISTPQLIKRTLHVSYDSLSDTYQGVPDKWLPEFRSRLIEQASTKQSSGMSFASLPASSALSLAATPEEATADGQDELDGAAGSPPPTPPPRLGLGRSYGAPPAARWSSQSHEPQQQQPQVWYDRCSRRFVNLPPHWRERLQRNNLTEWAEFQRNPALLTTVFTMMDEELRKMDLNQLGLDSSVHSSETALSQERRANSMHASNTADEAAASTGAAESAAAASAVVWHQQRSFVRDNDSDSEEFTEM